MSLRLRLSAAALLFLVLTATPTGAGATVSHGTVLRSVPGSALPMLRGATRLAATPSTTQIDVTVAMQPRNQALLAWTAAHSHDHPLSVAQLRALFAPTASQRARVVSYMRANGMALRSTGLLSLTFHGSASAASHAFHVGLSTYRAANGHVFRAPNGAVQLPASVGSLVGSVTGLDTELKLHATPPHAATVVAPHTAVPTPSCAGPGIVQSPPPNGYGFGYTPAELAHAYGTDNLITGGSDGSGERIAMIEFTGYSNSDINVYKNCFSVGTTVTPVPVSGGATDDYGAIEAELDIEVALTAAPGLDGIQVYEAPNNVSKIIPMVDAIINAGNIHIISDSWGLCEDYLPPAFIKSESDEMELAAAAGISYYSATGDDGSSDCKSANKSDNRLITDDPSSQPFVTAVGGTHLPSSASLAGSTVWEDLVHSPHGAAGGGVSEIWPAPAYQNGFSQTTGVDDGTKCGNTGGLCRQIPDISLNADPYTGYIMYCTVVVSGCPPKQYLRWFPIGGTSAAAPMMAALTADANTYSLAHGGSRMGFANPFLYANPGMFTDVTSQSNNLFSSGGSYLAGAGYDDASGLGSPNAGTLATDLAAYSYTAPTTPAASTMTITLPLAAKTIHYGQSVTLQGTLTGPGAVAIANRRAWIELVEGPNVYWHSVETDGSGNWSITLGTIVKRNTHWWAVFPGSDTEAGVTTPGPEIKVIPKLGNSAPTGANRGAKFTVHGTSTPNMHGVKVELQERRTKTGRWHNVAAVAVSKRGTYSHTLSFTTAGAAYVRWSYPGGASRPWMSATSRILKVNIH
jgi:subtilase family serine protease